MSGLDSLEYSMGDSDHRFNFPKGQNTYSGNWWMLADDLAEDFFDNHDGWESSWPQTLRIFSRGEQVAAFTVEMEREPVFRSYDLVEDDQ